MAILQVKINDEWVTTLINITRMAAMKRALLVRGECRVTDSHSRLYYVGGKLTRWQSQELTRGNSEYYAMLSSRELWNKMMGSIPDGWHTMALVNDNGTVYLEARYETR